MFVGRPPVRKIVDMHKERFCVLHDKPHGRDETVIVNPNHTLKNVVVFIKQGTNLTGMPPSASFVALDQYNCRYIPHIAVVTVNQPLKVINSDHLIAHDNHFYAKINPSLNFTFPGQNTPGLILSKILQFKKPEFIPVQCEIHPWMKATVAVLPNPFYSVTNVEGTFHIENLLPGIYTVEVWHEYYGLFIKKIVCKGEVQVNFAFPLRNKKNTAYRD